MERTTHRTVVGTLILLGVLLSAAMLYAVSNAQSAKAQQQPNTELTGFSQNNVFGLVDADNSQRLIRFNQNRPQNLLSNMMISGLDDGERLIGIDFRPATGRLYGIGDAGSVYIINFRTAAARNVATLTAAPTSDNPIPFVALEGDSFDIDFNPTVDRLRIVSDAGQNLRANVDNGDTLVDGDLNYIDDTDEDPNIVAVGYTNNRAVTGVTRLFDVDSGLNNLAQQVDANAGDLETIGPLGRNVGDAAGLDTAPGYGALAVLTPGNGNGNPRLFRVNLSNGTTIDRGRINTPANPTVDLALPLPLQGSPVPPGPGGPTTEPTDDTTTLSEGTNG